MTSPSHPVDKARYEKWAARLATPSLVHRIPAMLTLECKCLVEAYYGSWWKAGWTILWHGFQMEVRGIYWSSVVWFSDRMGWTKLRPFANLPGAFIRHGASCDRLNCSNIDCIYSDVPVWFSRLTGFNGDQE